MGGSIQQDVRFVPQPSGARHPPIHREAGWTAGYRGDGRRRLWNTLVLTAKVETLWTLGWRCFPEMMPLFEHVEGTAAVPSGPAVDEVYARMPRRNFSSGLLAQVPDRVAVVEAEGFHWSDWGNPERILETLVALGKTPTFPADLIAAAPTLHLGLSTCRRRPGADTDSR